MFILDENRDPRSGLKYNTLKGLKSSRTAIDKGEIELFRSGIVLQMLTVYKAEYPKSQFKSLQGLKALLISLLRDGQPIAITDNRACTSKTLRKMCVQLCALYPALMETRSGVSKQVDGVLVFHTSPTIQLKAMAREYMIKHWRDHLYRHKGKELDLKQYIPDRYEYDKLVREGKA